MKTFTITSTHLALLQGMYVGWNDMMYYGAPEIDVKRPYGNEDIHRDIAKMLKWKLVETIEGEVLSKKQYEMAEKLHRETETALQICLCTLSFKAGKYERKDEYNSRSWRKK